MIINFNNSKAHVSALKVGTVVSIESEDTLIYGHIKRFVKIGEISWFTVNFETTKYQESQIIASTDLNLEGY